ncbi:MAG TPA: hypothetical protein VKB46_17010 [Pyrinomonadaceae bacterium]|nr:hypothetical protein [Pyrinomonadaceae bacterium]
MLTRIDAFAQKRKYHQQKLVVRSSPFYKEPDGIVAAPTAKLKQPSRPVSQAALKRFGLLP